MSSERKTNEGKCPRCDTDNYQRLELNPEDDIIISNIICNNCGLEFTETFELTTQTWEKEDYEK